MYLIGEELMNEKMKTVTSPGQFFLYGEHGVVYNQPALIASTDLVVRSNFKKTDDSEFMIKSEDLGKVEGSITKKDSQWNISGKKGDIGKLKYVISAAEKTFNYIEKGDGIKISISSDIPPSSGLGSSSAVTTATIAGVSSLLNEELDRREIIKLAYQTEKEIQGFASKAGVSAATMGGCLSIKQNEIIPLNNFPQLKIVIGYTGNQSQTEKVIREVKRRMENRPNIYGPIIEGIGRNAREGIDAFKEADIAKLGTLMNVNQNLLESLGISTLQLEEIIEKAKYSGATGAKITGSGGGGCMIAMDKGNEKEIKSSINNKAHSSFITEIGGERLNIE